MRSDRRAPVAIVGGGFSGTMAAAQLARRGLRSLLIEGSCRAGRGTAYETPEPAHLLNVRADGMSAWPEDMAHFARYFVASGGAPREFAERRLFGEYLSGILEEAAASGLVEVIESRAVAARPEIGGWSIKLEGSDSLAVGALVLANGNQPPEPIPFEQSARFLGNPWSEAARAAVQMAAAADDAVLIVGTGLTMVDLVLSLTAAGHRGRIVALSRRGLIPRAHAEFDPSPVEFDDVPQDDVVGLTRWLRRRSGAVGWRAAIDSLRPHSQRLWQALSVEEQLRFARHARPWWDVHRHRIAPQVAQSLRDRVADGSLQILAGRIVGFDDDGDALSVRLARRGIAGNSAPQRFGYAFNCTGPLGRVARTTDPLLRQMLDDGLVKSDALGVGLEVDDASRLQGAPLAWALGPLTKGRFWEIVAVPDIRQQAAAVADDIARSLGDDPHA